MSLDGRPSDARLPRRPPIMTPLNASRSRTASGHGRTIALRLMHIGAETGARFVRERIGMEPIDWLVMPHRIFGGRAAIDACREAEGFRRALVLHGLSLGLDAAPEQVSGIPIAAFLSRAVVACLSPVPPHNRTEPEHRDDRPASLYTCSISSTLEHGHVQIFCAMIARTPMEVRLRLRHRYGPLLEDEAQVRLGFDWSEPLACAMVSEAMGHLLALASDDPTSPLAEGLDFQVEQRFSF